MIELVAVQRRLFERIEERVPSVHYELLLLHFLVAFFVLYVV